MAKNDKGEDTQEPKVEQPKESPMAKAVDPHAGLVKMHKDGKDMHAHPSVVKAHEKNGWKVH
jgi:hypothetical protein